MRIQRQGVYSHRTGGERKDRSYRAELLINGTNESNVMVSKWSEIMHLLPCNGAKCTILLDSNGRTKSAGRIRSELYWNWCEAITCWHEQHSASVIWFCVSITIMEGSRLQAIDVGGAVERLNVNHVVRSLVIQGCNGFSLTCPGDSSSSSTVTDGVTTPHQHV